MTHARIGRLHQLAPDGVKALASLQAEPIAKLKPTICLIMAQRPQFVAPEPRQGLMEVIFAENGQTKLIPLALMMKNEIR
jgi:hypothetical protein